MSTDDPYTWHRAALAGEKVLIHETEIQCGYFCRRMEYRGPLFPARIFWEGDRDEETGELLGDELIRCEVAGQRRDPEEEWPHLARLPISQAEYDSLIAELFTSENYVGPTRPIVRWIEEAPK